MDGDVARVRLYLRQIRVCGVLVDAPSRLEVAVESTVGRPRCPQCGFGCSRVHDTGERGVRDLEVSGRPTALVWRRRRFGCDDCGQRHLEDHPEFEGALRGRLERRLVADAQVMTISSVARRHEVGWHLVMGLVRS